MNLEEILKNFRYYKSPDGKFLLPFEGNRCCLNVALFPEEDGSILIMGRYPVLVKRGGKLIEFLAYLSAFLRDFDVGLSSEGIITVRTRTKSEEAVEGTVLLIAEVTEAVGNSFIAGNSFGERVDLFISAMEEFFNRIDRYLKESEG